MKRLSSCVLAIGVLSGAACGRRETPAPAPAVLTRSLVGDPATLDPTTIFEEEDLRVAAMIFRPLVGIDKDLRIVPALARSWTVSDDGLVYEFHLDPGARWESGAPVTSDDVRFTIERIRDPKVNATNWESGFEDLAGIETPDAATVRARFQKPYSERLLAFALPIVSAAAFGHAKPGDVDRRPVGSGPYALAGWTANQSLRLVRRPDAPAEKFPFAEIVFRIIPDDNTRFQAGVRGELDEFRISRDQRKATETMPEFLERYRVLKVPQPLDVLIVWGVRHPFLTDKRVRLALAHAWNRKEAALELYPPDGADLDSGPYPQGVEANAPDVLPVTYDLAESARLLDEAGWKAGPDGVRRKGARKASLELLVRAQGRLDNNLAEILRSAYARVGVVLKTAAVDSSVFTTRGQEGEFDAYLTARYFIPPNYDPFMYFASSQWPPNGQNVGFYKNAEADALMEAARGELSTEKRIEIYRKIQRVLAADPPADFLWNVSQYWGIARRLDGVEISPLALFHFEPGALGWRPAAAAPR
jgi:peptide/nickel transport system substrate-binding protein